MAEKTVGDGIDTASALFEAGYVIVQGLLELMPVLFALAWEQVRSLPLEAAVGYGLAIGLLWLVCWDSNRPRAPEK